MFSEAASCKVHVVVPWSVVYSGDCGLCGVVRGVLWTGVVWCGVLWTGVVWCGVLCTGVVWCGVLLTGCIEETTWTGLLATRETLVMTILVLAEI